MLQQLMLSSLPLSLFLSQWCFLTDSKKLSILHVTQRQFKWEALNNHKKMTYTSRQVSLAYQGMCLIVYAEKLLFVPPVLNPKLVEKVLALRMITCQYIKHVNVNHSVQLYLFIYPLFINLFIPQISNPALCFSETILGRNQTSRIIYVIQNKFQHFSKNKTKPSFVNLDFFCKCIRSSQVNRFISILQ